MFGIFQHVFNKFTLNVSQVLGLPWWLMDKNPPVNARDLGSIPVLRRFHLLWSNQAHARQLLSLCSRAQEQQLLSLCAANSEACAP